MRSAPAQGHDAPAAPPQPFHVTELDEQVSHLVAEPFVAGAPERSGMEALCGRRFRPAAMTAPDGRLCRLCDDIDRTSRPTG